MSRLLIAIVAVLILGMPASAATREQIDAAIAKGAAFLKKQPLGSDIGANALVGLALLESGARFDDPAVMAITKHIRDASYTQTNTYPVALCLLYLDRNADPVDVPLIQMLALRLLAGQNGDGGWTYSCIDAVTPPEDQWLRAQLGPNGKVKLERGKLHPDVITYGRALAARNRPNNPGDDNSNTQFGILGLWASRKHGMPVEAALDLVVERFIRTQDMATGGWPYSVGGAAADSPSMTCAGLLGLATGYARREEKYLKEVERKSEPTPTTGGGTSDPFIKPKSKPAEKPGKRAPDRLDFAMQRGMLGLGAMLANSARAGQGRLMLQNMGHGNHDLYFLWSMERVGVVFGLDKIGGVDWYAAGADSLVRAQAGDGSWPGGYPTEVNTAFAILFLTRSNVVKDLSQQVQRSTTDAELRAVTGPGGEVNGDPSTEPGASINPSVPGEPKPVLPLPLESESGKLASELLGAAPGEWDKKLYKVRDSKGSDFTVALLLAIPRLDAARKREAREALAERLVRMNPDTLRAMLKSKDPELRRGAVLAAAMKDDKAFIPDLIDRLMDEDDLVVRAAHAGLKSLSAGEDFGPKAGTTAAERKAAAAAWREWAKKK